MTNHCVPGAQHDIHIQILNVLKHHFLCPPQNDDVTQDYRHCQKLKMELWFSVTERKGPSALDWELGDLNQPLAFKSISPVLLHYSPNSIASALHICDFPNWHPHSILAPAASLLPQHRGLHQDQTSTVHGIKLSSSIK